MNARWQCMRKKYAYLFHGILIFVRVGGNSREKSIPDCKF